MRFSFVTASLPVLSINSNEVLVVLRRVNLESFQLFCVFLELINENQFADNFCYKFLLRFVVTGNEIIKLGEITVG